MEGREELPARAECRVVRGSLHREQQSRHDRQGKLLHERRRLSHASQEGPTAAGSALLQHAGKLISPSLTWPTEPPSRPRGGRASSTCPRAPSTGVRSALSCARNETLPGRSK